MRWASAAAKGRGELTAKERKPRKRDIEHYARTDKERVNNPPVGLVTPETIRAFRDAWEFGIRSYLTYLRDRLLLARELLADAAVTSRGLATRTRVAWARRIYGVAVGV